MINSKDLKKARESELWKFWKKDGTGRALSKCKGPEATGIARRQLAGVENSSDEVRGVCGEEHISTHL